MMFILLFLPTGLAVALPKLGLAAPGKDVLTALAYASPLIIIAIFAASIMLSLRIYNKKEM